MLVVLVEQYCLPLRVIGVQIGGQIKLFHCIVTFGFTKMRCINYQHSDVKVGDQEYPSEIANKGTNDMLVVNKD